MKGDFSTIVDLLANVCKHQANTNLHPLTCGKDSTHRLLEPRMSAGDEGYELILFCPDCTYEQDVPMFIQPPIRKE